MKQGGSHLQRVREVFHERFEGTEEANREEEEEEEEFRELEVRVCQGTLIPLLNSPSLSHLIATVDQKQWDSQVSSETAPYPVSSLIFLPQPIPDDGIYWQVNLDRFHQHFRDQAIVSAVANRMDQVMSRWVRQCSAENKAAHSAGCQMWPPAQRRQQ